MQNEMNIAQIR